MKQPTSEQKTETPKVFSNLKQEIVVRFRVRELSGREIWTQIFCFFAVISLVPLIIAYRTSSQHLCNDFLMWMKDNPILGACVFVDVYCICALLFIPRVVLTVGAGFIFSRILGDAAGAIIATLIVWIGACFGASIAFVISRYLLRERFRAWFDAKFDRSQYFNQIVERSGFVITLLLRITPLIPYSFLNYFMGLTPVSYKDYIYGHIGMLPVIFAYCLVGTQVGALDEVDLIDISSGSATIAVAFIGTGLTAVGLTLLCYKLCTEYNNMIEMEIVQSDSEDDVELAYSP